LLIADSEIHVTNAAADFLCIEFQGSARVPGRDGAVDNGRRPGAGGADRELMMGRHMTRRWRWMLPALAFSLALAGALRPANAAPPPIEHFTQHPLISGIALSPSGERMALVSFDAKGRKRLAVMGLSPRTEPKIVAGYNDADVRKVWWANDTRLVFEVFKEESAEVDDDGAATFAIDHDGSNFRELIIWRWATASTGTRIVSRVLPYGWFVHSTLDDGSDDIFVYRHVADAVGEHRELRLGRLDTRTGVLRKLSGDMPEGGSDWLLDHRNEPRVMNVRRDGRHKVFWRSPDSAKWTQLADFDPLGDGFTPWHLDADGQLLVRSYQTGGGVALYAYDLEKREVSAEPLVALKGFDLEPGKAIDRRTRRLVGLHFRTDRPMSYWFDDKLDSIQRSIDNALPGHNNRLVCGRCETSRFLVVHSSSDRHPGEYLLFDRQTSKLSTIGSARPWIDEKTQGRRSFHRVTARDGLSMPVYVTHPPGAKDTDPLPAVVLVHGGPYVRGSDLSWDAEAQFLASRGYRVIEPEFRGSTGYGWAHFKAGWKQWGLAMQDDLADAVQWAAKERLVDASRVCIMGASYGGYAALMGPIRHPKTYRCAISYAGVTDIELMYDIRWSDLGEQDKQYGMPRLIGDQIKDADQLRATSPLQRAAEIKVPVLLGHGGYDRRVPIAHASKFVSAARSAGVSIEDITYPEEGHGWMVPGTHADFLGRVETFLAKSLASP